MKVITLCVGPIQNNVYIAYDNTKRCIIVDAALDSCDAIMQAVNDHGLTAEYIFVTHTHWDHISELAKLKKETNAQICVHSSDAYRLNEEEPYSGFPIKLEPVAPDIIIQGDEIINCGDMKFRIIATPGHTEGGICFVEYSEKIVFVGDTVFNSSIGRTDLPGGDYGTLIDSIKHKLMILDDDFTVYCGHGAPTTIGNERRNNPFLYNAL